MYPNMLSVAVYIVLTFFFAPLLERSISLQRAAGWKYRLFRSSICQAKLTETLGSSAGLGRRRQEWFRVLKERTIDALASATWTTQNPWIVLRVSEYFPIPFLGKTVLWRKMIGRALTKYDKPLVPVIY